MIFVLAVISLGICRAEPIALKEQNWVSLSYSKIKANKVTFKESEMLIEVQKSAGPLVHKLEKPVRVSGFSIKGKLAGTKIAETAPFDEDSILRVGLVATGAKTLNWTKRMFAADWVKKLFSLAPRGTGLDKIYFFNVTDRRGLLNKSRSHPQSDLIEEQVVHVVEKTGAFQFQWTLQPAVETAAIWLSSDGDDTKSEFTLSVSEINLDHAP